MTTEAVIGIIVGVLTAGGLIGTWVWKLATRLATERAQEKQGTPVQTMPPQRTPVQPMSSITEMAGTIARVQKRCDDTYDLLKELTKWQVPGLEKVMTELAKEMARFTDTLDEIERALRKK